MKWRGRERGEREKEREGERERERERERDNWLFGGEGGGGKEEILAQREGQTDRRTTTERSIVGCLIGV